MSPPQTPFTNQQKSRRGLSRLMHAASYSWAGLLAGWREPAFRQELILCVPLLPAALWVGRTWFESALLISVTLLVLIVELLNTAVEAAVDRIGPEWHELSGKAKDLGSAAVLIALLLCGGVWAAAVYHRWA